MITWSVVYRELVCGIGAKQLRYFGHMRRNEGLENEAMRENIEGKRNEGRRRL